jgi:hypothetical protein
MEMSARRSVIRFGRRKCRARPAGDKRKRVSVRQNSISRKPRSPVKAGELRALAIQGRSWLEETEAPGRLWLATSIVFGSLILVFFF